MPNTNQWGLAMIISVCNCTQVGFYIFVMMDGSQFILFYLIHLKMDVRDVIGRDI